MTASNIGAVRPSRERVLLARVVRPEEHVRSDRRLGAVAEARLRADRMTEVGERPDRGVPAELPERDDHAARSSAARSRGPGTARRHRAPRSSACSPAGRSERPRRCRCRPGSGRRRLAWMPAGRPGHGACSAAHRKSPDASPVKTRPVRLPPCAAGASPTSRIRASGSPNPGTGRPQYGSSRNRLTFSRATRSRHSTSLGHRRHATISVGQRREPRPVRHDRYLSSRMSSRRDATTSPTRPITVRYATWTSSTGEIAPTDSDRMRSTPW